MSTANLDRPEPPGDGRHAWFDVSAGAAGDMVAGALVDAGCPLEVLQTAADAVVPGAIRWEQQTVIRGGLRATAVRPVVLEDRSQRAWSDIHDRLVTADLDDRVRSDAIHVFERLAMAEGRVHGTPAAEVHFHEVGGLDAIADVVGTCAALRHLDISEVSATPLSVGSGRTTAVHGNLPVPVPAVVELCTGWEVVAGGAGELATPTGASLITSLASRCGGLPPMRLRATGVGAGSRDTAERPNVVRVVIGTANDRAGATRTTEVVLEANVDDLDPRLWPTVLDDLLTQGASDAWLQPIAMKKGRPAHTLTILVPPDTVDALRQVVFDATSTIGLREHLVTKHALERTTVQIDVDGVPIRVKVALADGRVVHATPEFEDVAELARTSGRPTRAVMEAATAAVVNAGITSGERFPPDP